MFGDTWVSRFRGVADKGATARIQLEEVPSGVVEAEEVDCVYPVDHLVWDGGCHFSFPRDNADEHEPVDLDEADEAVYFVRG